MSCPPLVALSLLMLAACDPAAVDRLEPAADVGLPDATTTLADPVAGIVERAEMCAHWGGEEPYDDERRAQINAGAEAAGCEP